MHLVIRAALTIAAVSCGTTAHAGTLIVSGDTTIVPRTVTGIANGSPDLAGNIGFARNLLGSGSAVSIYEFSVVGSFPNAPLGTQLAGVYNTFSGVKATTFPAEISANALRGADLLVILGREFSYSADEIAAVGSFLSAGGNVLLTGESANIGFASNAFTNALLAGVGSSIRLGQVTEGIGDQFATGSEIAADELTNGVTSLGYGRTTTVTGGKTLFFNDSGNAFIAAEQIGAVPEPATWAMMLAGFGMIAGGLRHRRRKATVSYS